MHLLQPRSAALTPKRAAQPNRTDAHSSRRGFTMIEVMVALLVLTVAVQILSSTITASISYTRVKREKGAAVIAVTNLIEEMHSLPFYDLYPSYNGDPTDDPFGNGTAPGSNLAVQGLKPVRGQGSVVRIVFPEEDGVFCETVHDPRVGMPRDLNGDLVIDGNDRSEDYLILPVLVIAEWQSKQGKRRFEMATMLMDMDKREEEGE